jgi:predicted site-specific integrase-resolvase
MTAHGEGIEVVAKPTASIKQVAEELGVSAKWVRRQIAEGLIKPQRAGSKKNSRYLLSETDVETLRTRHAEEEGAGDTTVLARVSQLEADRSNLLAQVAWARAIAQEQQKTLEAERKRSGQLAADLEMQRQRVEQLKALSAWDRVIGRHKAI